MSIDTIKQTLDLVEVPVFVQNPDSDLIEVGTDKHRKIVAWIIIKGATEEQLTNFMVDKNIRFSEKEFGHLKDLIWWRNDPVFDLKLIKSQTTSRSEEIELFKKVKK